MRHRLIVTAALVVAVLLYSLLGPDGEAYFTFSGSTMGTSYSVKLGPLTEEELGPLQAAVKARLDEIVAVFSTWEAESEISRLNRNQSTEWVPVSAEFFGVVQEAQRLTGLTDGAFDVTVGPLVNLWGFGPDMGEEDIPPETAIQAARERVGVDKLSLRADPPAVRKTRGDVVIDLSAIAKGYGVDQLADLLAQRGVENYLVEIGGELRGQGLNHKDEPWRIAIEKPVPGERTIQRIVGLRNAGLATSGDYRNFFEMAGQRYAHVIDPATGFPVAHRLVSVTVLAEACMSADGLATGLMVLGPERALALAEEHDLAVYLIEITEQGEFKEHASAAMAPFLEDG